MEETISNLYRKSLPCKGLYSIMPISNIPSIMRCGILSHQRAELVQHKSIALNEVQDRRANVRIPNGLALHQYVNLYFDPRNPMMYCRKDIAQELCVLRIKFDILEKDNVVVSDRNASRGNVLFCTPLEGLAKLDFQTIFARSWADPDQYIWYEKKGIKCAEVLVPYQVTPEYIEVAYVVNETAQKALREIGFNNEIEVKPGIFFA